MSFMKKINDLTQSINDLDALQESATESDAFERRAKQLIPLAQKFRYIDQFVEVLHTLDPPIAIGEHKSMRLLLKYLSDLRKRYAENVNTIIKPFEDPEFHYKAHFLDPLESLSVALCEDIQSAWRSWSYTQLGLPDGMENVLTALGGIAIMRKRVEDIRGRIASAQQISDQLPTSQDVVERIHTLSKEINELWDSLVGNGVPDSALDFLLQAGTGGGVSYADLTDEVLSWLKAQDLLPSVRIKIG